MKHRVLARIARFMVAGIALSASLKRFIRSRMHTIGVDNSILHKGIVLFRIEGGVFLKTRHISPVK